MAAHDVVHEIPADAQLRLQSDPFLAQLRLQGARGPVQDYHVLGAQGMLREVHPEVAGRGSRAYRHPEDLRLGDPPSLDGHREKTVRQAGVAGAAVASRLLHAGAPGGPKLVFLEAGDQGARTALVRLALPFGIPAGYEASYRVFDDDRAVEEVGDLAGEPCDGVLVAAGVLEQGSRRSVGVAQ